MRKRKFKRLMRAFVCVLCLVIAVLVPVYGMASRKTATADEHAEMRVLNIWQIDNFEGGKGSRASYLQKVGNRFSKDNDCYVIVTALSHESAILNLNNGNKPDLISYGAGIWGIESLLKVEATVWCYGGYCFLTTDDNADFSDIRTDNTVINGGTGNLSGAAAIFCGISDAPIQKPTEAYVNLINKKFKYLLGTQRDIYRLKTRGENFKIRPIDSFNDLYQNISIVTSDKKAKVFAEKFVEYLISGSDEIKSLGLLVDGKTIYEDDMRHMEAITYKNTLQVAVSEEKRREIDDAIQNHDENKLKNLLN